MNVDLFDFELPKENIALRPVVPRDHARMLVVRPDTMPDTMLEDARVDALASFLEPGDVLVFNNTRVIPGRLTGKRGDAKIQITLHKRVSATVWDVFAKPAKKLRLGDTIKFDDLSATVEAIGEDGERTLKFNVAPDQMTAALEQHGVMPLPPYIASQRPVDAQDQSDYQTMYAKSDGAVAAPTAGLHFTPNLMQKLEERGVLKATVTLHVGAGTFLPVKVDNTQDHKMHSEWGEVTPETAALLNDVRGKGNRIVSVGTTSLRLLESAADDKGIVHPFEGDTAIFITPGYRFKAIDVLMTNFHLPRSTLFMLVSAFSGFETMHTAYEHAVQNKYRFYSYGDSSLLFPVKA
jgi:S-adenosylmethionine:tRNA ribosyltransferase-isomerase